MLILFLIVFVDMVSFGIILPLLPAIGLAHGFSEVDIGIISASFSFSMLISATLFGILSDIIGRRKIVVYSLLLMSFSYVLLEFAQSFEAILISRMLAGIGAGNIGVGFAIASDISSKEKRAFYIGVLSASFGLGFIIGPGLGGLLAGNDIQNPNFLLANGAATVACFVAFIIAFFLLKESLPKEARAKANISDIAKTTLTTIKKTFASRSIAILFIINALLGGTFAGMETFIIVWNVDFLGWGPKTNGYFITFFALIVAVTQVISPLVIKNSNKALFSGLIIFTISTLFYVIAKTPAILTIVVIFNAIGLGIVFPALNSSLSHTGEQNEQGAIFGLSQSLGAIGRASVPIFLGYIYVHSQEMIWIICALIALACVFMAYKVIGLEKIKQL